MDNLKYLIFDADDTLWENNIYYEIAREKFFSICLKYSILKAEAEQKFVQTEIRLVYEKGYGTANFLLILNTLFDELLPSKARSQFDLLLKEFRLTVNRQRKTFPGVENTLSKLAERYQLFVLTKGDLNEQKTKIEKSGLNHFFTEKFIVSEKDDETYLTIIAEQKWRSSEVCMIGNSPKSDINPALKAGMWAIFIPYAHTWFLEDEPLNTNQTRLIKIGRFSELEKIL